MKFKSFLFLLFLATTSAFAQTKHVQGFVVDKDSKLRLAKVYIYNPANDDALFNNTKGEFTLEAKSGDTIFAALSGYAMDTVVYKNQSAIVFQLKPLSIRLKQINVLGKLPSAKEQYDKNLKDYKYQLDKGSSKDLLNLGSGGVGLGIDAIYNLLSREGKNARRLQGIIEKDYHEQIIDYRYRPDYVKTLIKIKDEKLRDFMSQYRPTYDFVLSANEYEFVAFVKNSYASYKRNPTLFKLPTLPTADTVEKP
jgi:hypothetical protein